jgi:hypothetical protein
MKKQIYQSPHAFAVNLIGRTMISTSMILGNTELKISDGTDIGFVKGYNSQIRDVDLWDNEW